jgi:hypothetical protein
MMDDRQFDVYVAQIITAARSDDARERVTVLLNEFQEKCYLSGRHALIDRIRSELNNFDIRPNKKAR